MSSIRRLSVFAIFAISCLFAVSHAYMHNGSTLNGAPLAVNDSYTVHGSTVIGPFFANDTDPDGDTISLNDFPSWPSHGSLNGSYAPDYRLYTPQAGYVGPDSFTYRARDSFSNISNTAL
jgi:hypothetical protein